MGRTFAVVVVALSLAFGAGPAAAKSGGGAFHRHVHGFGVARIIRSAERGDPRAQALLGFMYEFGRRVPQDYRLAAMWYARAAAQGEPHGQHFLGLLYDKGFGVTEDVVEAYKWLNLAAAHVPGARERDYYIRMRNAVASKMDRYQIAEGQARARAWRPVRERR